MQRFVYQLRDGRGQHMKPVKEKNRKAVKKWMLSNPSGTMKECTKSIGLSYRTVLNHYHAIMEEA